ncbi:hypothetical protein NIES4074_37130 [Cylindrospermum sp. NIES-4074]|nr:hypothetical protein NIES4074_37130 [Cylindrospermum sp. NIES-4074]
MEEIAAGTEGLQLESGDRAEVMGSLAEVGQGGGAAAVGGGGGGGGAAIADKPVPPVPDVSQSEPSQALASIGKLPPAQLLGALGGVSAAVGNTVGKQRAELAANPPQMEQPTGAPTKEGAAGDRPLPQSATPKPVEKAPEGQAQPVPQPQPITLPPAPTVKAVSPPVKGDAEGKVSANDAEAMKASLRQIPTTDPNLQVNAGAPPPLELTGNADPQQAQEQKAKLEQGVTAAHTQGQQELAQPMGENEIYPQIVPETLKAEGIGGNATAPEAPVIEGIVGDDAVSIIAQQEHGAEIQAAVAQAQGQISAKQQEHTAQVAQEKATNQQEIAKLQQENTAQQSAERSKAQAEVQKQKEDWNKEQTDLVAKSRADAEAEIAKGNKEVEQEQTQAEAKASEHIEKGNTEAEAARKQGEKDAEQERSKGEKESGGIFGWLADKAKSFFDGIKQAIQKAFEIARAAVKAAIETAQKLATAVIEAARQAIVSVIKRVGDALIALGDVLLAAFPEMRERFRNAIKATVQAAEAAVNALAENLKQGVQAALNLLGKALDAALGLLEKGYLMAVDFASKAVQGAISAAKAAVDVLGTFAVLIKDIAGNPGQWLSNLGAGAKDGVQNHLWTAFQVAVQAWFGQKVEEVLGLGMTVWNVLNQGGIKVEEVGAMAWEGIKSAIPPALIQLLIEKVVSMIIPAAGTVMLIIEGLQAAWGTVSRILQAMEKFISFLKAVKSGQSGPQFAEMLAAAGVVLIEFVSIWLLKRLRGAASKVAAKVREIAKKIGKKLKKGLKRLKRKLGKVKDKFFGKKGDKNKNTPENKDKQKDQRSKEQKSQDLQKAVEEIKAQSRNKLVRGPIFKLALSRIKNKYKLTTLTANKSGKGSELKIYAKINPDITFEVAFVDEDAKRIGNVSCQRIDSLENKTLENIKSIIEQVKNQQVSPSYSLEWGSGGEHQQIPVFLIKETQKFLIGTIWQQTYIPISKSEGHPNQKLFQKIADKEHYVLDKKGQYVKRYIYRNISPQDVETLKDKRKRHIEPTGSKSRVTPLQHVEGKKPSPYISTTKTSGDITNPQGENFDYHGKVKIDLLYIDPENILDLTTKVGQDEWGFSATAKGAALQALKDVIRTQEVLIKGTIPKDAIQDLRK